jgi:hypothetical protein
MILSIRLCLMACLVLLPALSQAAPAGDGATSADAATGRTTLYVSKLGDNSDGSNWAKALHTIAGALDRVPDDGGGHRIIIRPDVYMEANLQSPHKGAAGAYNRMIGDHDGALGSGATGWVVIDSGQPGKGFKSFDWHTTIRAYAKGWSKEHTEETFSANGFDRWMFEHLYATGSDAGLFFDLVDKVEPFTVIVQDCVGIGRAFGGGVANCLSRADEPITFRRCTLWALDWWGDTAAAYCRVENKAMPSKPDVAFDDCTMVSPQCALKSSNFGFTSFTRLRVSNCRLIALNFSQPHGTPTDGIIQSVEHGKYLHLEISDSILMGYKVFGVIVNKPTAGEIGLTLGGDVRAYVQFQQEVPKGIRRLDRWPVETFQSLLPKIPQAK